MKRTRSALLRACLLACIPIAGYAQTEAVVFEAESGALGANIATGVDGAVTFITTTVNTTTPPSVPHIATYSVTFPAAGNYELYARYSVGPDAANDDSWYFGQGFGVKTPEVAAQWALQNEPGTGFTNPTATVLNGGTAGSNVFKWVKITGSQGPATWTVPAGSLTQTFQFGTRENGMRMDKFAFGRPGVCYTVNDLNIAGPATGTCPPPPPPDPPPYTRTDPPIATGKSKYLGAAWSPGTASLNFANYWNQVTPENGGKWGTVEATRDVMNWTQADAAYALAKANGFKFKWHTFIWGNQQPAWIESLSTAEQREEIEEWYAAVAERYPDIDQIEVVNEPLHDPPRGATNGNYIQALGGQALAANEDWQWIVTAFTLARQYFPKAELILNDYSITNDGNATTNYLTIINLLKERGLIDAIGDQAHAFSTTEAAPMNNHKNNLNRLAATGLPIYITELDIDGVLTGVVNDPVQVANFQRIFPTFWEHPAVKGVTIWGYVRGFHWRNAQGDWLLYPNGGERPALQWLIRYVNNQAGAVLEKQGFEVPESAAGGTTLGTVLASDPDAGTTFSQWQLQDPSGKFAINAATGTLSLLPTASLDHETAVKHLVNVSAWDGYARTAWEVVKVHVGNVNDHVPVIPGGQAFTVGSDRVIGWLDAFDEDDTNQPGYSNLKGWTILSGNESGAFELHPNSGRLEVANAGLLSPGTYSLVVTVNDGVNTSASQTVTVTVP